MSSDWKETALMTLLAIAIVALHTLMALVVVLAWGVFAGLFPYPASFFIGLAGGVPIGACIAVGYINLEETPAAILVCAIADRFAPD